MKIPTLGKSDVVRHPLKEDAFDTIKKMGAPIGDILDVGVQTCTKELLEAFPDRRHILMEPLTEFNDRIERIYGQAGIDFEIINAAISDQDGEVLMHLQSVFEGESVSHAYMIDEAKHGQSVRTVPQLTLDTVVETRALREPYLLKVDIDGAELSVLAGAQETLKKCGFVVIEVGPSNILQRSEPLRKAGFQVFDMVDFCYYNGRFSQADLIFARTDMLVENELQMYKDPFDVGKWKSYRPS